MENILEIKNLSKTYKNFKLDDVSFNLPLGYIMGFIGANGAGKSTTIKLIMNLLKRDSGEIKVFGQDNIKDEIDVKERIGFVYDQCFYYDHLKVKAIEKIVAPFYKNFSHEKFKNYCVDFKIDETKKIKQLSLGNKLKVSIALALSHNPGLLIMDEPTSGLDPIFRDHFLDILRDIIQDEKKSILFSTHITSDLDRIADYITLIDNGKIILSDVKDDILDNNLVIKGDYASLDDVQKDMLIGTKKSHYNFDALINKNDQNNFTKANFLFERPTLEDIMLYNSRG